MRVVKGVNVNVADNVVVVIGARVVVVVFKGVVVYVENGVVVNVAAGVVVGVVVIAEQHTCEVQRLFVHMMLDAPGLGSQPARQAKKTHNFGKGVVVNVSNASGVVVGVVGIGAQHLPASLRVQTGPMQNIAEALGFNVQPRGQGHVIHNPGLGVVVIVATTGRQHILMSH